MNEGFVVRLLKRLWFRGKTARQGGLFHELNYSRQQVEAVDEIVEKLKEKSKGYRDG